MTLGRAWQHLGVAIFFYIFHQINKKCLHIDRSIYKHTHAQREREREREGGSMHCQGFACSRYFDMGLASGACTIKLLMAVILAVLL
jgi:hypothetical protein